MNNFQNGFYLIWNIPLTANIVNSFRFRIFNILWHYCVCERSSSTFLYRLRSSSSPSKNKNYSAHIIFLFCEFTLKIKPEENNQHLLPTAFSFIQMTNTFFLIIRFNTYTDYTVNTQTYRVINNQLTKVKHLQRRDGKTNVLQLMIKMNWIYKS